MFEAKLAIVRYLRRFLPYSDTITPRFVSPEVSSRAFVEAAQGLQDQGVPTRLIVYKGFGHGIDKPKELLAATWHNWEWFGEHVWR